MRRLAPTVLFALLVPAAAFAQSDEAPRPTERPFLWRIESSPPSYLYGTIHVPDDRVTTLPTVVTQALESCDVVVTEIAMDQMGGMAKHLVLPRGESLKDLLPETTYAKLEAHLETAGLPVQAFHRYKVWAVMMTLVQLEFMDDLRAGKKALDQVIWNEARDAGADGDALEVLADQLGVFDAFTVDEQIEMLDGTLDLSAEMRAKGESMVGSVVDTYLEGDAQALMDVMDELDPIRRPELADRFKKLLLVDRNVRMAEGIIAKMAAAPDKVFFFAVGTAHYPGKTGILALLEAEGVRVTRLPTTEDKISEILRRLRQIEQRLDGLEKQRKAG